MAFEFRLPNISEKLRGMGSKIVHDPYLPISHALRAHSLARKVESLLNLEPPTVAHEFVPWLLDRLELEYLYCSNYAGLVRESGKEGALYWTTEFGQAVVDSVHTIQKQIEAEHVFVEQQYPVLIEDLADSMDPDLINAYLLNGAGYVFRPIVGQQTRRSTSLDPVEEDVIRDEIFGAYGVQHRSNADMWCCARAEWAKEKVFGMRLVPWNFDTPWLDMIFGVHNSTLAAPKNAICLNRAIFHLLIDARIAIVPVSIRSGHLTEWKIISLWGDARTLNTLSEVYDPGSDS